MHEDLLAGLPNDEAEALGVVEPLNLASGHSPSPFLKSERQRKKSGSNTGMSSRRPQTLALSAGNTRRGDITTKLSGCQADCIDKGQVGVNCC